MKKLINEKELNDRAAFFCEKLFGIKLLIPVKFFHGVDEYMDVLNNNVKGMFRASNDEGSLSGDESCDIIINDNLVKASFGNINDLNDTLIHELTHYYLWFMGYDSEDDSKDFIDKLNELGVSNNYDLRYDIRDEFGCGTKKCDYDKLQQYENMYQEYKLNK